MPKLNQGDEFDAAERAGREDHDEAEQAVDERHGAAVGRAEQESAPPAAGLRSGADDRQVDRDHRQHARRQVQRQAADEGDREDRGQTTADEPAVGSDTGFGVLHELEKGVGCA
jgi:hypothetical protein